MVVRVEVVGEKATTINLFRPYLDDGVRFENDYTAQGQLYNWNNATPHVLDCVIGFRSFEGVLSDDPRPFSHITHIGLVHEPFNTGRIQCDLSIDTSGVVADSFGPSGQSASDLFAMSVYQGSNWSIGDPSHLMAARTRHIDLTTEQLHKVDASGGASDTGITLHVFTTVPYAQMARLDWASVTVRNGATPRSIAISVVRSPVRPASTQVSRAPPTAGGLPSPVIASPATRSTA